MSHPDLDPEKIQTSGIQTFGTMELRSAREAAIGLVGGSKKMTAVYWMTPFAAAAAILFSYLKMPPEATQQFWDLFTVLAGGYLGGQSAVDIATNLTSLLKKNETPGNVSGS